MESLSQRRLNHQRSIRTRLKLSQHAKFCEYLCNIQRQCSQVSFPFLLNESITRRRHRTKHHKSPSFKIQSHTPRQRIRRNTSNHYNYPHSPRELMPTASFLCPFANRLALLFLPISLAFRLTIYPVTITPLPTNTTATSTLFLLIHACKRSSVV